MSSVSIPRFTNLSLIFLLLLLAVAAPGYAAATATANSIEVIQETCYALSARHSEISYSECLHTLSSASETRGADSIASLGLASIKLGKNQAAHALSLVRNLLGKHRYMECRRDEQWLCTCLELYKDILHELRDVEADYAAKRMQHVDAKFFDVIKASDTCGRKFEDRLIIPSQLFKELRTAVFLSRVVGGIMKIIV